MGDEPALPSAQVLRYDALLRVAKALGSHRTIAELFQVLAERLHPLVPFDYLALLLHDQPHEELRLVLLEPADLEPPFTSRPVAEPGPAATVWQTQIPYDDAVLALMEQIAGIVAIAVENGLNREQAQRNELELRDERDRLQFMLDVNNLLVSRLDYRGLLEAISETVQRIVAADHIGVALYDDESGELRADVIYNKARGFTSPGGSLPLDASAAGITFQRGVPALYRRAELEGLGWKGPRR